MVSKIQSIRGMNDILPEHGTKLLALEELLFRLLQQCGYQEVRTPILEPTELFVRSIGDGTDVVEKEMYTFSDRSGQSVTLRPEGTASCIRAGIEHGLFYHQLQRWFYCGPMFRYERPQKGRYRQFHQFGVEAYGLRGPDIDFEVLLIAHSIWLQLGLQSRVVLQLNNLGSTESRAEYRRALVDYLEQHYDELDEDSKRRLIKNPIRILDSKKTEMQELLKGAPKILDYLDDESRRQFSQLIEMLQQTNINYEINPHLVRGLDYYNGTVFEWVIRDQVTLAQNAVCAGGHYDNLVASLGGSQTPAVGFAIGMERLCDLVSEHGSLALASPKKIYFITLGENSLPYGMLIARDLRASHRELVVVSNCDGGDLRAQLRRADKSGADLAVILEDSQLSRKEVTIKYLRDERPQRGVAWGDLDQDWWL